MNSDSFWLILCGAGVIQSLFLSVYIFNFKKIQRTERILLASLLLAITARLVKSLGWYYYGIDYPYFLNVGFAAHAFIGSLLVLYFLKKTFGSPSLLSRVLILLPGISLLIGTPFLTLENFWYVGGYKSLLYLTIIYLIWGAYLLLIILRQKKIYFPWYRNLFTGVTLFCISYFTNYIFGLNPYITGPVVYTVAIYFISFVMFTNHDIFTPLGDRKKYKNINLTTEQIAHHHDRIRDVMNNHKPYLDSDFSLTGLSQLTSIPKHLLSRFFSENMNQNFTDFTNGYRIENAQKLLKDPSFSSLKISHIAYESGFNSISSFNAAFRKITSVSPSEFRKKTTDSDM